MRDEKLLVDKSIVKDMVSDIEKMDFARREIQNEIIPALTCFKKFLSTGYLAIVLKS